MLPFRVTEILSKQIKNTFCKHFHITQKMIHLEYKGGIYEF